MLYANKDQINLLNDTEAECVHAAVHNEMQLTFLLFVRDTQVPRPYCKVVEASTMGPVPTKPKKEAMRADTLN